MKRDELFESEPEYTLKLYSGWDKEVMMSVNELYEHFKARLISDCVQLCNEIVEEKLSEKDD